MIIGIVIGSGIFFKSDNVLAFTGGSVPWGILVFCIGAFGIIFGCLTLSELSIRTEKNGEILLGEHGAKVILTFVLISILGVLNGLILGNLRMPQALASKNMLPGSGKVKEINQKINLSIRSCVISFVAALAWLVILFYMLE